MKNYLFAGVSGIGMSALALFVKQVEECGVIGIDFHSDARKDVLSEHGIRIVENINSIDWSKIDEVVYTSALRDDDPLLKKPMELGIKTIRRGEKLNNLMERFDKVIGVTGTHGKTTTTAILSNIMINSKIPSSAYVGGIMLNYGSNFYFGGSECLIAELDESDGSFLNAKVDCAVITNVEFEHVNYYKNIDELKRCILGFVNNVKKDGVVVLGEGLEWVKEKVNRKDLSFFCLREDFGNGFNINTEQGEKCYVKFGEKKIFIDNEALAGKYNLDNAALACAAAFVMGADENSIDCGIKSFLGVRRRFELVFEREGIKFISDYAHHPTEIKAVVKRAKDVFKGENITVIFQPHRITRFSRFYNEFLEALSGAEDVFVTEIYSAGENVKDNKLVESFVKSLRNDYGKKASFLNTSKIFDKIDFFKNRGVYIFLGAGSIDNIAKELASLL